MGLGILNLQKQFRNPVILDGISFSAGIAAKGTGQIGFAASGLTCSDDI